ncbi:MAG TPA: GNAT family N-acetyltransferase [Planctomycetota bacterium]|nr:GNAT family N-acetyltransferase [Planctomycetota bacterium]
MIPVFRPSLGDEEIAAVAEVLRSGWIGLGPKTAAFERAFAESVGARHAVGTASGTAALHLALLGLGVGPGDEVIVPSLTFVSTAHAVRYCGGVPVFADVEEETLCLDPRDVRRKISPRTKAILPVHYGGHPADLDALQALARRHRLLLLEDAAHAAGAEYGGRRVGSPGPSAAVCFSFHAVKNLTTGEGGMVTTDDEGLARRLRELRWMGISRDTWERTKGDAVHAWRYEVRSLGWKAHLSDIQAAIGLVQLRKLDAGNARRREIALRYAAALRDLPGVRIPVERPGLRSSWHLYPIRAQRRDDLLAFLKKRGIAPGVHYFPLHLHPYYLETGEKARFAGPGTCPVAERAWKELLSLPLYPGLAEAEIEAVVRAVRDFREECAWKVSRLDGEGVVLREVEPADLPLLRRWRNDPASRRWFFDPRPVTEEAHEAWYNGYLRAEDEVLFVIEGEGRPIGTIGLVGIDRRRGTAELGRMLIGEGSARGKGFGKASVRLLLRYAFGPVGLSRVFLEVQEDNARAIGVYEACGFRREGVLRESYEDERGLRRNKLLLAILRSERAGAGERSGGPGGGEPSAPRPPSLDGPTESRNKTRHPPVSGPASRTSGGRRSAGRSRPPLR